MAWRDESVANSSVSPTGKIAGTGTSKAVAV